MIDAADGAPYVLCEHVGPGPRAPHRAVDARGPRLALALAAAAALPRPPSSSPTPGTSAFRPPCRSPWTCISTRPCCSSTCAAFRWSGSTCGRIPAPRKSCSANRQRHLAARITSSSSDLLIVVPAAARVEAHPAQSLLPHRFPPGRLRAPQRRLAGVQQGRPRLGTHRAHAGRRSSIDRARRRREPRPVEKDPMRWYLEGVKLPACAAMLALLLLCCIPRSRPGDAGRRDRDRRFGLRARRPGALDQPRAVHPAVLHCRALGSEGTNLTLGGTGSIAWAAYVTGADTGRRGGRRGVRVQPPEPEHAPDAPDPRPGAVRADLLPVRGADVSRRWA